MGHHPSPCCRDHGFLVLVLSLPCALGFNVLSGVTVPAVGDIQSIEDFIVSTTCFPLGAPVLRAVLHDAQGLGLG